MFCLREFVSFAFYSDPGFLRKAECQVQERGTKQQRSAKGLQKKNQRTPKLLVARDFVF